MKAAGAADAAENDWETLGCGVSEIEAVNSGELAGKLCAETGE
ncbi:hypothetical protein PLO_1488 [Pediococcus acidilactici NGRI 0510Q]|nr:hypothetical protein PLO_1488 [Pediococcus acidilactici NGRI 0510Q]